MKLAAVLFAALVLMSTAAQASDDRDNPPLSASEVQAYRQIAHRIFDRVVALKQHYPHLVTIEVATQKDEPGDRLWVGYHYTHNMTWVSNPDYRPEMKGGDRVKSFAPDDGVEINLYFYEGSWPGQAAVHPFSIGAMNVVSFIEGRDTPAIAALRRDVVSILVEEKTAAAH